MGVAQFLGWKYRDYLTNSWVGTCPELMDSFSPRALPALYSTSRSEVYNLVRLLWQLSNGVLQLMVTVHYMQWQPIWPPKNTFEVKQRENLLGWGCEGSQTVVLHSVAFFLPNVSF